MTAFHTETDPRLPGVRRVARSAALPRPHVGVLAALHGDEICGLEVHETLLHAAEAGTLPLARGTLVLIHGNPEATRLGVRHTPTGYDLHRICNLAFQRSLPEARWGYEHRRALALAPVLDDLDAAIDLHSASSPTVPFAVALPGAEELSRGLGVRWVTHAWHEASDIADGVALARVASRGKPAAAVECGQHHDREAPRVGWAIVRRFLRSLGLWDEPVEAGEQARLLRVFASLPKPSEGFRFVRPLEGFERVQEGQLLGRDGEVELRSPADGYAVLPNDAVPVGKNVVYLAREEP